MGLCEGGGGDPLEPLGKNPRSGGKRRGKTLAAEASFIAYRGRLAKEGGSLAHQLALLYYTLGGFESFTPPPQIDNWELL